MRVAHLILPSLAALALAGASSATASTGGGSVPAGGTSVAGTTQPGAGGATQPSAGACTPTSTSTPAATATSGGAGLGAAAQPSSQPSAQPAPLPCPLPTVAGTKAQVIDGLAYAPTEAPIQVQEAIWAGDRIRFKPYLYAGGHGKWNDVGYDCSGTVSYVLHAAGLLKTSMDSSEFMSWGRRGAGQWMTVYTNPGHAFIEIAGIRFDTSAEQEGTWVQVPAGTGPRWRPLMTSTTGFEARHPAGL